MTTRKKIVITGIGVISSIGSSRQGFWSALTNGVSGVGTITAFDATPYTTRIASEVRDFDPLVYLSRKMAKRMARNSQMAVGAAMDAVKDAGLDLANEQPQMEMNALPQKAIYEIIDRAGCRPLEVREDLYAGHGSVLSHIFVVQKR